MDLLECVMCYKKKNINKCFKNTGEPICDECIHDNDYNEDNVGYIEDLWAESPEKIVDKIL